MAKCNYCKEELPRVYETAIIDGKEVPLCKTCDLELYEGFYYG